MDKNIGILHISDIHISSDNSATISRLINQLKTDIAKVSHDNDVDIKMVCISGDLINSGDNSSTELELAMDTFLQPLMDMLGLTAHSIFIVPGNHEVKRSQIVPYVEKGLESTLVSEERIAEFLHKIDDHSISRISYFNTEFSSLFGGTPVWENPLSKAYLHDIGNITIGVACINSAWRSTGIGSAEKRKMIIGQKQIVDCFEKIKDADLKICVVHHPFDWLIDDDKVAIEKCISQFDIVLNGHIHESDTKQYTTFNGQTLFNTCGKFDDTSDIYNGYSIISINPFNKDCTVFLRQHFGFPRNCFDSALCVAENGLFTTNVGSKSDLSALAYNISHSIERNFLEYANSFFVSNVTAGHISKTFNESFIIPEFNRYSEYEKETMIDTEEKDKDADVITLEELCTTKSNILLLGKKEAGKTTILHYIAKFYFSNFNSLRTVPIVIDASQIDYSGKNVIPRAIQKFINNYCSEKDAFSISNIDNLIQAGMFTIMFDSFDSVKPNGLKKINEFLEAYPSNRYIFSERESISSRYMRDKLLFKGGTSLSKCHKLINRFSEDIDLTLEEDPVTQGQKKEVKQAVKETCEELHLFLLNEADTRSRRDFNRYEIDYSPECPTIAIKPILLVETTFIVKSYPSEENLAASMIYDYMVSIRQEAFAEQYGLMPFPILVQTLDRTLIDKVFALCDYYLTGRVAEHSRHIYDIYKLVDVVPLDSAFVELFHRVRADRRSGNSQCVSADERYSITELLQEILDKAIYKAD